MKKCHIYDLCEPETDGLVRLFTIFSMFEHVQTFHAIMTALIHFYPQKNYAAIYRCIRKSKLQLLLTMQNMQICVMWLGELMPF